eukprot:CAMPEP_0179896986 /NCGR_PEP_ID=MMETSP0982-20121206/36726_1 /TAXON_ID=483367 /ORGANISM="non described non described, Strain CCMP 2436" /LENGTH=88 /DNA_ID=CAMNT_0021793909 /DNA_START=8 /DNA_END=274 /DNA_ORIENTATION=-
MASEEPGAAVEVDPHQLQSTQELTTFVQTLLTQMQGRFATMSDQIIGRIDEMGTRIDELESSIGELMTQAGVEDDAAADPNAADAVGE